MPRKRPGQPKRLPTVSFACLCEKALYEKDGTVSLIRIIDFARLAVPSDDLPDSIPYGFEATVALGVKPGGVRGRHEIALFLELPSGTTQKENSWPVNFEDEFAGFNLFGKYIFAHKERGHYKFIVKFDGTPFAEIPFRVIDLEKTSENLNQDDIDH